MAYVTAADSARGSTQSLKYRTTFGSNQLNEEDVGIFKILNDDYNAGQVDPNLSLDITVSPLDGELNLIKGQCKRIVFSYKFPNNLRQFVIHSAKIVDPSAGKYVTWCGLYLKKVDQYLIEMNSSDGKLLLTGWTKFSVRQPCRCWLESNALP